MRRGLVFPLIAWSCAASLAACSATQNLGSDGASDGGDGSIGDGAAQADGASTGDGGGQGNGDGGGQGNGDAGGREGGVSTGLAPRLLAGGQEFMCGVASGGAVKCWGTDFYGELGDGQTLFNPVSTPTSTKVLTSGVVALAAHFRHVCALTGTGAVYCWGQSSQGSTGTGNDTSTPALVTGLGAGVAEIIAGEGHTCARMTTGAVKCWGGNLDHQIGNDGVAESQTTTPTDTAVTSGALRLAAGTNHTCVLLSPGVSCWGSNAMGVLGSAATGSTATPVAVPGTSGTVDIAATGTNTCALDGNGAVKCWGSGLAPFTDSTWTPVGVTALFPGGISHMCGITKTGAILCWGSDSDGELGDGTNKGSGPLGPSGITAISVGTGDEFTCAMTPAGAVTCFGLNDMYQLGNTKGTPNTYTPTVVAGF